MEKFFKTPFLEMLYNSLSENFEKSILEDKKERKKYYDISAEEEKLYDMLKDIVGVDNDENKLKNLMEVIREIEEYCCKETDYWNRKYFKLGFTYMFELYLQTQEEKSTKPMKKEDEKERISFLVHNFLNNLRERKINEDQRKNFFDFIEQLDIGTKLQKRRFCLYYDIGENEKVPTFDSIAKKERCTKEATTYSIKRFASLLVNLSNEDYKRQLLEIIKNK